LDSLAKLQRGEGWVWYPEGEYLKRVTFPPIRTFDSSATPTDGAIVAKPRYTSAINLTEIKDALADAVKEADANDPKKLRARIAELESNRGHPKLDRDAITKADQRGYERGLKFAADALSPIMPQLRRMSGNLID